MCWALVLLQPVLGRESLEQNERMVKQAWNMKQATQPIYSLMVEKWVCCSTPMTFVIFSVPLQNWIIYLHKKSLRFPKPIICIVFGKILIKNKKFFFSLQYIILGKLAAAARILRNVHMHAYRYICMCRYTYMYIYTCVYTYIQWNTNIYEWDNIRNEYL